MKFFRPFCFILTTDQNKGLLHGNSKELLVSSPLFHVEKWKTQSLQREKGMLPQRRKPLK